MRILFLTQWFDPEPHYKALSFVKAFRDKGHQVQVLTGFPNYPGGKLYEGYKVKFLQKELMDGIQVIRVPLYPSHDSSSVGRFANFVSFALSAGIIGPWVTKKVDLVYVYNPPSTVCFSAGFFKLFKRIPIIYDIQDLWPESLADSDMFQNKFGLWLVDMFCRFYYKLADKIVVLSPGYKDELIKRGVPETKIQVIYNWCLDSVIRPVVRDESLMSQLGLVGKFNIMFAGNMGKAQSLGSVLEAARIVAERSPDIQFVFVGGGVDMEELKKKKSDMNLDNVLFLKSRPVNEISNILSLADVLLVHLKEYPLFTITIPSKIQAYMAVGKPIMAGVKGNAAELVLQAEAGIPCEPDAPESIAETAIKFRQLNPKQLKAMGENGRKFYAQKLCMKIGIDSFENIFKSVIKNKQNAELYS